MSKDSDYVFELANILSLARLMVADRYDNLLQTGLHAPNTLREGTVNLDAIFAAVYVCGLEEDDKKLVRTLVVLIDRWIHDEHELLVGSIEQIRSQERDSHAYKYVIRFLNEEILAPFEREMTAHGISRTFRFWNRQQKLCYIGFASRVMAALRRLTVNVCFGYGTVLGYVREHDLIQHDDDLDIIIAFDINHLSGFSEALSYVSSYLTTVSFVVDGDFPAHLHVSDGNNTLDVFIGIIEDDRISFFPGLRRGLDFKSLFPPIKVVFFDEEIYVPANPSIYLDQVYGPDWRCPLPQWRHTWNFDNFTDIK